MSMRMLRYISRRNHRPFRLIEIQLKFNNGNTRTVSEIGSKLTIKTPEQNFEQILQIVF